MEGPLLCLDDEEDGGGGGVRAAQLHRRIQHQQQQQHSTSEIKNQFITKGGKMEFHLRLDGFGTIH